MDVQSKIKTIRLVIFDVDGVFTDGRLYYGENGEFLKVFHVHDGAGIRRLIKSGMKVGIISGRSSQAVRTRMEELGVEHVFLGQQDKASCFDELLETVNYSVDTPIKPVEVAVVGDDLPDIPMLEKAGFAIAVANATPPVMAVTNWTTTRPGGNGAVRDVCELFLNAHE